MGESSSWCTDDELYTTAEMSFLGSVTCDWIATFPWPCTELLGPTALSILYPSNPGLFRENVTEHCPSTCDVNCLDHKAVVDAGSLAKGFSGGGGWLSGSGDVDEGGDGLSTGAVIGITIAGTVGVLGIIGVAVALGRSAVKRRRKRQPSLTELESRPLTPPPVGHKHKPFSRG